MELSQLSAYPQRIRKAKMPTFLVLTAYPCHQQRSYMVLRLLLYHHSTMCILSLPQFPQKATFVVLSQPFSHHIISSGPQSTLVAFKTPVATTASWWASVFPHHSSICGLSLPQRPQKASLVVLSLPPKPPQHPGCLQLTLVVTTTLCLSTDKPVSH